MSVQIQTSPPACHILIDDCSTDSTLEHAKKLQAECLRVPIKIVARAYNGNAATARNDGIALCNTRFFAVLDADDWALPDWLETIVPIISSGDDVAAAGGGGIKVSPQGIPLLQVCPHERYITATQRARAGLNPFFHPGSIFRLSDVRAIGGYNPDFAPSEDLQLYKKLANRHQLKSITRPLVYYRIHSGSLSQTQRKRQSSLATALRPKAATTDDSKSAKQCYHNVKSPPPTNDQPGTYNFAIGVLYAAAGHGSHARRHLLSSVRSRHKMFRSILHFICSYIPNGTLTLQRLRARRFDEICLPDSFLPTDQPSSSRRS